MKSNAKVPSPLRNGFAVIAVGARSFSRASKGDGVAYD